MTKAMKARFPGTCSGCGFRITPGEDIEWSKGVGARHASAAGCAAAKLLKGGVSTTQVVGQEVKVDALVAFLQGAKNRGLKFPKARFLGPLDPNPTELRLSLAGSQSKHPGSVQVVLVHLKMKTDEYLGRIAPDGDVKGMLLQLPEVLRILREVVKNPAKAASDYGALMGHCSFCGLPLTDAGSVSVGYGPICADRWGLPHVYVGVPTLKPVPTV